MKKDNSKIITQFWYSRLSSEIKKYGIKTSLNDQQILGLSDADSQRKYANCFMESVLRGIGNRIPQDLISAECRESMNYKKTAVFYIDVNIKHDDKLTKDDWNPPSFYMTLSADTVVSCKIVLGQRYTNGAVSSRNLKCDNPEYFGKIMAGIYESRNEDVQKCKIEVAKSDKMQQMVGVTLCTMLERHLKTLGLPWAVSEGANGKVQINIKFTPRKVLTMTVQSSAFDNDFKKLLNAIDMLNQLICKDKVELTVRGEKSSDYIKWQIPDSRE